VIQSQKTYREHPSVDVDVLAFDVTSLLVNYPVIESKQFPIGQVATKSVLENDDIKIGDEIIVIGYPSGLSHKKTNFPLIRKGIISSMIGELLEDDFKGDDGILRKRTIRGFFIDGAIIPGSSGSPIILNPLTMRFVGQNTSIQSKNLLLGIIAETLYAPISLPRRETYGFAGLVLAFDSETIIETIDLFG
jgi:hypothetical protein